MELIIKPTGKCNFNCTFCSADSLNIAHPKDGTVPEKLAELIQDMKPDHIIVTGGEPLTVDPMYYWRLHEIANCHIGFTTNLKDFWTHPDKWQDMFKHPDFGVITSFNYGESRLWDAHTVYTEEMFREVTQLYNDITGRPLPFIAVIDENNEERMMDHVYLARDLRTQVKLNAACKMGRQGTNYPKYKMIQTYINIIDMGLGEYEMTCHDRKLGRCAFNTNLMCANTIRCCYIDTDGNLHYGNCEDLISIGQEIPMDTEFPVKAKAVFPAKDAIINEKCINCELFRFCNGCRAHSANAKDFPEYCDEMLKLKDDLIRQGWAM